MPDQVHGTNEGLTADGPVITGGRSPDMCSGAWAKVSQLQQVQRNCAAECYYLQVEFLARSTGRA